MNQKLPKSRLPARPQDEEEDVIRHSIGVDKDDDDFGDFDEKPTQQSRPARPDADAEEEETDARIRPGSSLPAIPQFAEEKKPAAPKRPAKAVEFEPDSPDSFSDDDEYSAHFGKIPKDREMEQDIAWDITERSNLPYVKPRDGYRQRWIRFEDTRGNPDTKRINKMVHGKHWRPRHPNSLPENVSLISKKLKGIGSVLIVEGMVLCELPEYIAARYERIQREDTERLTIAEKENLLNQGRQGNVRIGYENKSEVVKGGGKVPKFA